MTKDIFHKAKRFPKGHLAIAGSLMSVTVLALAVLPSSEVEATRKQIQLIEPTAKFSVPVEAETTNIATLTPESERAAIESELETSPNSSALEVPTEQVRKQEASINELVATAQTQAPTSESEPSWIEYRVQSGDNLTKLFKRAGLGPRDVYEVSQADVNSHYFSKLRPGQTVALVVDSGSLERLKIIQSKLESIEFYRTEQGFDVSMHVAEPEIQTQFVYGTIDSSLFLGAQRAGLSDNITMKLANIFAWDIDFALDIRKGDHFRVLYQESYLDGEKIGEGDILAAEFTNNGDTFAALRYEDSQGNASYFTPEGRSMRKAFLRSPVDFRRISSNFNPERYHPVLGKKRPHRGTDYAAATGTPIKASGDGKVIWRATKGGYGRTVILQHGGNITTLYAHLSKYKPGVTSGTRVKQGDIIGYVGQSGTATGPHLHYEFRLSGVHKNPVTVKLPDAAPINGPELAKFKAQTNNLIAELQRQAVEQVALLD